MNRRRCKECGEECQWTGMGMGKWFLESESSSSGVEEGEELTDMERQLLGIAAVDGGRMDLDTVGPQ
jgi:hypothetical protein